MTPLDITPEAMAATAAADRLDIRLVAGRIGAEIRGVRLSGEVDDATAEAIRMAIARHKVVFFRDQQHLDDEGHEAFTARLGTPIAHPMEKRRPGVIFPVDSAHYGKVSSWHTDSTYVADYPWATVLRAVVLPSFGGDTTWANMCTAYLKLPEQLRQFADAARQIHTNFFDYAAMRPDESSEKLARVAQAQLSNMIECEHPLVRVHPVTGEPTLILGHFFKRFVGLSQADSTRLFAVLQEHVTRPEHTVRWTWREGDVAIWDNRATQHYAIDDYEERRVMRRITMEGDVPVGLDGRQSVQILPAASESTAAA